jgi:hypothetical protein
MFCTPGLVFGGTEGVGSPFHVLRARTRFWRYRGRRIPFSYFSFSDSFSAVPGASGPVFMFCAPGLIFGDTDGASSPVFIFCALRLFLVVPRASSLVFIIWQYRQRFRRYRERRVPFSCFARPESYSVVPRSSGPVFKFCVPKHVFSGVEGIRSCFHVLRSCTSFRRYRGRRVLFLCFALPSTFSAVSRAWGPVFMFCAPVPAVSRASGPVFMLTAPGLIFGGTEGVWSNFNVLRAGTRFWRY